MELLPAEPWVLVLAGGSIPKFGVHVTSLAGLTWLDWIPPSGNLICPRQTGIGSGNTSTQVCVCTNPISVASVTIFNFIGCRDMFQKLLLSSDPVSCDVMQK